MRGPAGPINIPVLQSGLLVPQTINNITPIVNIAYSIQYFFKCSILRSF